MRDLKRGTNATVVMATIAITTMMVLGGCDSEHTVVENQNHDNSPPQITLAGPEYDSSQPLKAAPNLWVMVTDPDGEKDVAAVLLTGTVTLNSFIVRPDSATAPCAWVHYADGDTIDVRRHLTTNVYKLSQFMNVAGTRNVYTSFLSFYMLTDGGVESHLQGAGPLVHECYSGVDWNMYLERFGLRRPALSPARDVYVTWADVSVSDITVKAFDQSGAIADTTLPGFRVIYSNVREDATLP